MGKAPEASEILTAAVVSRTMVLNQGQFCPPGGESTWTHSWLSHLRVWGTLLVSSGWRPEVLPACYSP